MKKIYYVLLIIPSCHAIDQTTEIEFDPIKYGNKVYEEKDPKTVANTEEREKKELQELLGIVPEAKNLIRPELGKSIADRQ